MCFQNSLLTTVNKGIVIIDDDESIHIIWQNRFKQIKTMNVDLLHFTSPQQLIDWFNNKSSETNVLYLCDYEFVESDINGIDLIESLGISFTSILVTSSVLNRIITRCAAENIKLLPKNLASVVDII